MAEKLKIISLGGLNEIGKNMTVYEYGEDIIVVDVGMGFPDDDMYGIDVVIPDITYLIKNKDRIRGIFLTHGHEDHIGAMPYVMRDIHAPVYATRMTAGLVELKLDEHKLLDKTTIRDLRGGRRDPGLASSPWSSSIEPLHRRRSGLCHHLPGGHRGPHRRLQDRPHPPSPAA